MDNIQLVCHDLGFETASRAELEEAGIFLLVFPSDYGRPPWEDGHWSEETPAALFVHASSISFLTPSKPDSSFSHA